MLACARAGIVFSAPCGGRRHCGKCKVKLLEGQVKGDTPDNEGWVRSCITIPVSDITIEAPISKEIAGSEVSPVSLSSANQSPASIDAAAVAIDIGTTTVSARLLDLTASSVLDTISELNDQRIFGADVMSRIQAARNGKTAELFNLINQQTKRIINSFQKKWDILKIEKLSVSGNTVMLHLFLNVDPSGMGEVPFTPMFLEQKEVKGESLSLPVDNVIILPSISAFIGGDITAGLAVLDILNIAGPSLLIDIGTNGEMALHHKGTIFCCSTAAGPAFEGAEISCGMGGIRGAISAVEIAAPGSANADASFGSASAFGSAYGRTNALTITTIGNAEPTGICGAGLIDSVAVMLKLGIIDETGSMTNKNNNQNGFCLVPPRIFITARDIRQFQLAKSAILSGIKILCKNAGLKTKEIKNVFIAGGFGFFINKKNAVDAGVFPKEFLNIISICGNLSLQGAEENINEKSFMNKCKEIIEKCSVVDLAADPSFMEEFTENMLFMDGKK